MNFKELILQGIPSTLPNKRPYDTSINHAPKRKEILNTEEKNLALRNALRYFREEQHATLMTEFKEELEAYGRIYMFRFKPTYEIYARPIEEYPGQCLQAKGIMLMIQNNLDIARRWHWTRNNGKWIDFAGNNRQKISA